MSLPYFLLTWIPKDGEEWKGAINAVLLKTFHVTIKAHKTIIQIKNEVVNQTEDNAVIFKVFCFIS